MSNQQCCRCKRQRGILEFDRNSRGHIYKTCRDCLVCLMCLIKSIHYRHELTSRKKAKQSTQRRRGPIPRLQELDIDRDTIVAIEVSKLKQF